MGLICTACVFQSLVFADNQDQISTISNKMSVLSDDIEQLEDELNEEKARLMTAMIRSNVNYLESTIQYEIKHADARKDKYKNNLNTCSTELEAQMWLKKMNASEEKLKTLTELLNTTLTWKAKV